MKNTPISKESAHGWLALYCGSLDWQSAIALLNSVPNDLRQELIESLHEKHRDWIKGYWERWQRFKERANNDCCI